MKKRVLDTDLFLLREEEVKYNCRKKYYVNVVTGELVCYDEIVAKRYIFNPDGAEVSERTKAYNRRDELEVLLREEYGLSGKYKADKDEKGNAQRSKRRAKNRLFDLIMCNDFDCFVTLTLSSDKIDRNDYTAVIKKLSTYLDNRVRRNGLVYVGVPELHKKGGFHFHFLCNASALRLVDSGTVSCKGKKKPIKCATADRYGVPFEDRQTVYNIADWSLGFTTAIMTYGERGAVANYIGKYITKSDSKICGRWYYSGGNLRKPVVVYDRVSYDDVTDYTYDFDCDGGSFKVVKFDKSGKIQKTDTLDVE